MSRFSAFSPTPKQRENLAKLATYLEALPADYQHFRVAAYYGEFVSNEDDQPYLDIELELSNPLTRKAPNECGTCACAVGHGPSAGIRVYGDWDWGAYCNRVFGTTITREAGKYMFGPEWSDDHLAAAARIRAVLA